MIAAPRLLTGTCGPGFGAFSWDEIKVTFDINAATYAHAILTAAACQPIRSARETMIPSGPRT
jgi:hypothetical protein